MTITQRAFTKLEAWTMFRAEKLGLEEGQSALVKMTDEEMDAYMVHANDFDLKLAQIGVEAQNEAAAIMQDNPDLGAELGDLKGYDWTAEHYIKFVALFKGTKFEKLHLSAQFRIQNAELLLELVKP